MKKLFIASLLILTSYVSNAVASWGAIAYDSYNGNYGYSYGYGTQAQAMTRALTGCNNINCRIVTSVSNGWIALSVSNTTYGTYGTGYSPDEWAALYWSMYYCNRGPSSCHLTVLVNSNQ